MIKPPRALWVPFELGRPLGVPKDPAFQQRVLLAALKLLEEPYGPVLADFPEEASVTATPAQPLSCPIVLSQKFTEADSSEGLRDAFLREVDQMVVWYREAEKKRGRTTYGLSGLRPLEAARLLVDLLDNKTPSNLRDDLSLPAMVRLASEDIKALYMEAATARPGGFADSVSLTNWFFGQCVAGMIWRRLQEVMCQRQDKESKMVGKLMIPLSQAN